MTGVTGSLWMLQIRHLSVAVTSISCRLTPDQKKVAYLIERVGEITVADAVRETGMDQATIRRHLDAITPSHALLIEGKPRRWRRVEN